ncbi:MAG: helix-turn-helix transcriptional regulator [Rhodospirillales bacterium]|nr:MAG: helix-turn-helix transcriptional regulator [Rhodospirillales bacterium]
MLEIKQKDLARAAGISLATLNNIERGVADPRSSTLAAIERALGTVGIEVADDGLTEEVCLHRLSRPSSYDTLFASQRVLETIGPTSLVRIRRILFFARIDAQDGAMAPRICLLIEGRSRTVLFDLVDFTVENDSRAAEVAGIMLACYAFHRDRLYFLDRPLEDTTTADVSETVSRLMDMPWRRMEHPRDFFNVFDNWDGHLLNYARRPGHPMRDLVAQLLKPRQD